MSFFHNKMDFFHKR